MQLHVHSWGAGVDPSLICIHGVTGHGERFRRLAEERLTGRRVRAVDLRGHGRSGWEPPWSLGQHVRDMIDTADALGIETADWLGFSFGGRIAAELAQQAPERIGKLILLDPALRLPAAYALEAAEDERTVQTFASVDEAIQARYDGGSVISTPREILEEEMRQHLVAAGDGRLVARYSRSAAVAAWGEMASEPPPPADVPTLIALGTESQVPNAEHVERYRAALGDSVTVVRIQSGHSLLWDAFDQTARAVADFL